MALFGRQDWISRYNDGLDTQVQIQHGPLGRALHVQSERLREYLVWLLDKGYIRDLEMFRGRSVFTVRNPSTWNWHVVPEESAGGD